MPDKAQTLEEFAATNRRAFPNWVQDTLPDDIRAQIASSDAPTATIVKWLHSLGYEAATENKISKWRQRARRAQ